MPHRKGQQHKTSSPHSRLESQFNTVIYTVHGCRQVLNVKHGGGTNKVRVVHREILRSHAHFETCAHTL